MMELTPRRSFLRQMASLPIIGFGAAASTDSSEAETDDLLRQIKIAETRCLVAQRAYDEAIQAFEEAHPKLHWTLDRCERPAMFNWSLETRAFDGAAPKRGIGSDGQPFSRYVSTVSSLSRDLEECDCDDRRRGKIIRRMLRRAQRYEDAVKRAERAYGLWPAHIELNDAQQSMDELCDAVFGRPATTLPAVQAQAAMICTYATVIKEQRATFRAGLYGRQLAENLQKLGRAA